MSAYSLTTVRKGRWNVKDADGHKVGEIHKQEEGEPVLSGSIMVGRRAPRGYYARRTNGRSVWFPLQSDALAYFDNTAQSNPEENTMTATVKRGAGRPAANASRTRHAQRTPLPPKAEKRDPQQVETTTRKRRAAVTGSEESPNPTRPAAGTCALCGKAHRQGSAIEMRHSAEFKAQQTAKRSQARNAGIREREAAQDAKQAAKGSERAPKRVAERPAGTRKGRPSATAKELPEDFPGRSKAMRLLDGPAQEAGWVGSVKVTDAKTGAAEVSITKGDETMTWFCVDGKQDPAQAPRYTDGRRTVQMKNIAAILAQATGERAWIKPETAKAPRKSAAKRTATPEEPVKQALPFDVELASEREIASALQGRSVTWQNRISGAVESAVLASRARVRLEIHPTTRERIITFNDANGLGTRSVRLSGILNIK
jgi:hypothetical protein